MPKNMRVLRIRTPNTGFVNIDAAEEGRRWQEAELRRKDETFAAAEEKHRRQVGTNLVRLKTITYHAIYRK
jgi:hypothetical protein